ncbi:TfoX/Sxy family protein [Rhodovibrionaceae bacterium A322]
MPSVSDKQARQLAKEKRLARAQSVLARLVPLGPVELRHMFGGHALYMEDAIFGLIGEDVIWLKVDDQTKETFRDAGSRPFVYTGKNKPVEMPYWSVPEGCEDSPAELLPWAQLAVEAGQRAAEKKRAAQRKKTERQQKAIAILDSL